MICPADEARMALWFTLPPGRIGGDIRPALSACRPSSRCLVVRKLVIIGHDERVAWRRGRWVWSGWNQL